MFALGTGNVYTDTIAPLLQRTCTNCHKPGKTKGELLLTTPEACAAWLQGSPEEAATLQRPLPAEALRIVATGARKDEGGTGVA